MHRIIDDVAHHTLVAASTMESEIASTLEHTDNCKQLQQLLAKLLRKKPLKKVSARPFSTGADTFTTAKLKHWLTQQEKLVYNSKQGGKDVEKNRSKHTRS